VTDGALLAELRALRADVAALREDQQHAVRRMVAIVDRRDLGPLMRLIVDQVGHQLWTVAALWQAARQSPNRALQTTLEEWRTGSGFRVFGNFLERCDGVSIEGLRLVRCGSDKDGALWKVERVSGASKPGMVVE
jgi:hypothetical protein